MCRLQVVSIKMLLLLAYDNVNESPPVILRYVLNSLNSVKGQKFSGISFSDLDTLRKTRTFKSPRVCVGSEDEFHLQCCSIDYRIMVDDGKGKNNFIKLIPVKFLLPATLQLLLISGHP